MRDWLRLCVLAVGILAVPAMAVPADDLAVLDTQAKRFWAAEVRKDWDAVYEMLPAADKGTMTREQYATLRKERGPYQYTTAQVGEVLVEGDAAWVRVQYEYKLPRYPDVEPRQAQTWHRWQRTPDGWRPVPRDELPQWPLRPPQRRPAAEEAALTERANAFWRAKVTKDWIAVYDYLTPDFRAEVSRDEFLKSRVKYVFVSPRVEWAEVDAQHGRTKVRYAFRFADPAASKQEPIERTAVDTWRKVDGQWYYDFVSNKGF